MKIRFYLVSISLRMDSEAYLEPSQPSKMELFAKIVQGFQPLTIR